MTNHTTVSKNPAVNANHAPPIVWTVAGSDSGGGAGLQADLRALQAFGVHGCTAVAAITAQNSTAVQRIEAVSADLLDAQLSSLATDMPPAAIKTGMLGNADNAQVLARYVDKLRQTHAQLPLVIDPVLRASTGAALASDTLLAAYRQDLIPRATLMTPNRLEAAALLGCAPLVTPAQVKAAAVALQALGCASVVITGGDAAGERSQDYAITPHASGWLSLPRVATRHNHGTGCVFAASAAAALALGYVSIDAIILAKMATTHALWHAYAAGTGSGPALPATDFASHIDNLPHFSLPNQLADAPSVKFAALSDAALGLYAVVGSAAWVQRVIQAGVRTVQLRIKDPQQVNLRDEIRLSIAAARATGVQLFINDHWQIAIEEGAYGVHLGQEDLAIANLHAIANAGVRLGISTHSYWEVCRASAVQPSYIACGPIHATASKDMPWLPQGNGNLAYWSSVLPTPVVGIAGMNEERTQQAAASGAAGVAVITAITGAVEPEARIATLQAAFAAGRAVQKTADAPKLARPTL